MLIIRNYRHLMHTQNRLLPWPTTAGMQSVEHKMYLVSHSFEMKTNSMKETATCLLETGSNGWIS